MAFSKTNLTKGTCFSCKIVYTSQEEVNKYLVSLDTDPDYSVFNVRNLTGIMTSIDMRCCLQCGGKLRSSVDDHTDEEMSCSSQVDMSISRQKCDQAARKITLEPDSWNPNRIMMQGILSKRGRTTKT